eukprot:4619349-Pleurochrysis_carterae.AAC.2
MRSAFSKVSPRSKVSSLILCRHDNSRFPFSCTAAARLSRLCAGATEIESRRSAVSRFLMLLVTPAYSISTSILTLRHMHHLPFGTLLSRASGRATYSLRKI